VARGGARREEADSKAFVSAGHIPSGEETQFESVSLSRQFIARTGRFSASPLHDLIEGLEIRPRLSIREIPRRLECRNLFRNGRSHELVDACSVLAAQPLDRVF
jgi:hypothetical protein